jgi:hypothetical protein
LAVLDVFRVEQTLMRVVRVVEIGCVPRRGVDTERIDRRLLAGAGVDGLREARRLR